MSDIETSSRQIDRAFIMELVYGCVRYRLYLEWIMRNFIKDASRTKHYTSLNVMMAIYQMLFMRVPDWAAVNEAVEIEKHIKGTPSLVNGVLRNYIKKKERLKLPPLSEDPISNISLSTSHPSWLVKKWAERFKTEELFAFAKSNNEIPPLTVRVNTIKSTLQEVTDSLKKRNILYEYSAYCPEGIIMKNASFPSISDLLGLIFIQDEASQLISYLLGAVQGDYILDACAAPGGKTTHIAQITENRARIIALDIEASRIEKLSENIEAFGATSVEIMRSDIHTHQPGHLYDRILLDAPCSALGVIRRNPDVKYRHNRDNLIRLGEKQLKMLQQVSRMLASNGSIVYAVCSTEPEETSDVVQAFLNINKEFYIINDINDVTIADTHKEKINTLFNKEGYLITYPHIHNMDGFFAVRLRKK